MDGEDFVGDSEEEEEEVADERTPPTDEVSFSETSRALSVGDASAIARAEAVDAVQNQPREADSVDDQDAWANTTVASDGTVDVAGSGASEEVSSDCHASVERAEVPEEDPQAPFEAQLEARKSTRTTDTIEGARVSEALEEPPLNRRPEAVEVDAGPQATFKVGHIVHVASRTWPGINKLGGAGKIASVITDTSDSGTVEFLYNVKYMLGGFEKRIEEEFIQDLADALETGVRQHKERVFYHDEYAKDPHKKQRSVYSDPAPISPQAPEGVKPSETTPEKNGDTAHRSRKSSKIKKASEMREKPVLVDAPDIEYRVRSSDDSDYDEAEDLISGDQGHARQIDDGSFILDERHTTASQRKRSRKRQNKRSQQRRGEERRKSSERQSSDPTGFRARKKRPRRIIESDDEDEKSEHEDDSEEADRAEQLASVQRSSEHKVRPKKRRYIGGYEHGSEDAEGSFIQPEGNPAELPDDVVKELQFRLGTSKAELRTQLESVADRLLENLGEFEDRKSDVASRLELSTSLDNAGLQDMNRKLLDLGEFVRTKFIRSGEDVMNLIIKMLEKKGASLPDRIDLQFENWKQRVAEHDVWVKQSLRALENTFNRRGFSDAFRDDVQREETSSESDSSSESNRSDQDDFEMLDVQSPSSKSTRSFSSSMIGPHPNRQQRRGGSANESSSFESSMVRQASKKRPRSALRVQSSLDGFTVPISEISRKEPRALTASNFRFVRGRDDKILKDPRWDWARTLSRNRSSGSGAARPQPTAASLLHTRPRMGHMTTAIQKSESVMEAVLRLRDKRFRDRTVRPISFPQSGRFQSSLREPPITHRSALENRPRIAIDEGYGSHKILYVSGSADSDDIVPIEHEPRKWSSIFAVLSAQENIPRLQPAVTISFAALGTFPEYHEESCEEEPPSLDADFSASTIAQQASSLRQLLNTLRAMEKDAMDDILKERSHPESEIPYTQRDSWRVVSVLGNLFHSELGVFVKSLCQVLREMHGSEVTRMLRSIVTELNYLLKQVPDCITSFGDSPSYAYFFEVAAPGSKTTPLVTAICRLYWYLIQLVVMLKATYEQKWPESRKEWRPVIEDSLSLNRVALAACLFLIDLYIHVPSTHRFLSEDELSGDGPVVEAPALALWRWLYEIFASGTIQSNKTSETSSLWNVLQTAYKQGIIDLVGISFMKRETFGGYVREHPPTKVLDSDEELQGKLLAADVLWDLSCVLGSLFHPMADSKPLALSTSWNLVKQLLSAEAAGFVPLTSLPHYSLDHEFQLQAHGFKLRVLRRLLVLSAIWPPDSEILEKLFPRLWDSVQEEEDQAVLSLIIDFIGEVRLLEDKKNDHQRYALSLEHATRTTNSVELFCKIAVVQLSKLEKAIHRVRYRQPVLRAISAHAEKHKSTITFCSKKNEEAATLSASTSVKAATKAWNWTKGGSGSQGDVAVPQPVKTHSLYTESSRSMPKQVVVEIYGILSIIMMFGLSTVYLDDESSAPQQSARRKRELKREIDFFCKELSSVSCEVPETSARLCECLAAVGTASLDIGVSYSTPFERLDSLLKWATDKLHHVRQVESEKRQKFSAQTKLLAGVASASLRALRDLSAQLFDQLETRSNDEPHEVESCISTALGSGLAAAIDAIVDGTLQQADLDLTIEILMIWTPKSDHPPTRSLQFLPSTTQESRGEFDEFDEFDDPEMMDLLATVELGAGVASTTSHENSIRLLQDRARAVAQGSLRLAIQKILPSFPQRCWRSYEELYVFDLMGSMIATCKFPFSWSSVSLTSLKPRMFAPRLMGSILQHRGDSDWFSTCFLSEQNADAELSSMWLIATLDLRALFPTTCNPAASSGLVGDGAKSGSDRRSKTAKYSSYWLSLTDGILANLLKEDPVVRYKMDPLMFRLLHSTATHCSYGHMIRDCSDPRDVGSLYNMHVDIFRAFCQSAGNIWLSISGDQARHRQDMNRFRAKMMDPQRGVFVTLPEAYEINLRAVSQELDRKKLNWYSLSSRFLNEFSAPSGTISLHIVDDATSLLDRELTDPAIRPLIILYKFMYDCVDSFLFHCGGMAIGQHNIFYSIIQLMFRQARCAEFPVAERRLRQTTSSSHPGVQPTKLTSVAHLAGISPPCVAFTESVRLFFAYQKYPSLINWFVQNLETFQTLKGGWPTSPLRVLLYNVFDPHGPLGIHSYYPMQDDSSKGFDPRIIRREAFYFACGLLHCRCSGSYEHTRCTSLLDQETRRSQLRRFILVDFVRELSGAADVEGDNMDESLLPFFQLVKAFLNHLNLDGSANLRKSSPEAAMCVEQDLLPCLVFVGQYAVRKLATNGPIDDIISCVTLIEFVCIVEELVRTNLVLQDAKVQRVIDVGLRCAGYAHHALSRFSSTPLEQLFTDESSTGYDEAAMLRDLEALVVNSGRDAVETEPGLADVKIEPAQQHSQDDYGIGKARVRSDLLTVIRRLVKTCSDHTVHSLLIRTLPSRTAEDAATEKVHVPPLAQVSVDGTM